MCFDYRVRAGPVTRSNSGALPRMPQRGGGID